MTEGKRERAEAHEPDRADAVEDLEVTDDDQADAVKGGLNPQPLPPRTAFKK
jgi:hypothetical protein